MHSLVYVSSAVNPFTESELVTLLARSRENNERAGITGMLVYKGGNFMQLLEGDATAIRALHEKLGRDPRHYGLVTLLEEPIEARRFPDWSMGFRNLHSPEVQATPGFNEFLNSDLTGREFRDNPSRAQKLLLSFKKNM